MPRLSLLTMAALTFTSAVVSQQCKLQFDARVPADTDPKDFDTKTSPFLTDNVIGKGLKFSEVLSLPSVTPSLFYVKTSAVQVSISDDSIFNNQTGFRRCELLPESVDGKDPASQGVKTIHFSVQSVADKKLNTTHEYQLAFMEDNAFSTNQWVLKTGTIAGQKEDPEDLVLLGNVNDGKILFTTPFTPSTFHNFALTQDFNQNQISVFYSTDSSDLKLVADKKDNDNSGGGQFHFGVLRKGLGSSDDITKNGIQPKGVDDAVVFGGIFQEDSSDGCMSTSA